MSEKLDYGSGSFNRFMDSLRGNTPVKVTPNANMTEEEVALAFLNIDQLDKMDAVDQVGKLIAAIIERHFKTILDDIKLSGTAEEFRDQMIARMPPLLKELGTYNFYQFDVNMTANEDPSKGFIARCIAHHTSKNSLPFTFTLGPPPKPQ